MHIAKVELPVVGNDTALCNLTHFVTEKGIHFLNRDAGARNKGAFLCEAC